MAGHRRLNGGPPAGNQTGEQHVIVRAATDNSHVDLQAYLISVSLQNTAPVITSTASGLAVVGQAWTYAVLAQDAEQVELRYALSGPSFEEVDELDGVVRWTPTSNQIGEHDFLVEVADGSGETSDPQTQEGTR